MCGFCGYFDPFARSSGAPETIAREMSDAIAHRGPDGAGVWRDKAAGLALIHRRLAIIDPSSAGTQPMQSSSKRFWIVYNGEIYNHLSLRAELVDAGYEYKWVGHSDTETLLACIEAWGIVKTLSRAVGMFALALWDTKQQTLLLARDRMGEKPLYYGVQNGVYLFGSELNALRQHPSFSARIDPKVLPLYLRHSYVPAPYSIYAQISKLKPGHALRVRFEGGTFTEDHICYWSLDEVALRGSKSALLQVDSGSLTDELDAILTQSVESQLLSDMPVGAFLSGGVDSSTIVALMQKVSSKAVRTFSIGFDDPAYDEACFAAPVAKHLGTDHCELIISPKQSLEAIPLLPKIYSEPFADSSQIPTFLVAQLAREHVSVVLSGDGADELFSGYSRYLSAWRTWQRLARFPTPLRNCLRSILLSRSPAEWEMIYSKLKPVLPAKLGHRMLGEKAHKLADALMSEDPAAFFHRVTSLHSAPEEFLLEKSSYASSLSRPDTWPSLSQFEEVMMVMDATTYLPDDILVKVDRATMACGLEGRAPFLDHRVVETAWNLPFALKAGSGQGKWLLREVLFRYVPRELIERPKMGFGIPIGVWMRGALRPWVEELLDPAKMVMDGYFNVTAVQALWQEHLHGRKNHQHFLWNILMFQAWLNEYHR